MNNPVKLLIALFIGVFCGYILGWYFSPATKTVVEKPSLDAPAEVTDSLKEKLSDIAISDSGNLLVSTPRPGDTITTPLHINGLVRVFENRFHVRIVNKDGVEVRKGSFTAKNGELGQYLAISVDLTFAQPTVPGPGRLEVFTLSAKDGSEQDKVVIPIEFTAHGGSGL